MISVKLFTDKRVWCRKYDKRIAKKRIHIWDEQGQFLDKKKCNETDKRRSGVAEAVTAEAKTTEKKKTGLKPVYADILTDEGDGALSPYDAVFDTDRSAVRIDDNGYTEERLHIVIDMTINRKSDTSDKYRQGEVILRRKRNQRGHIVLHTYECIIPLLLQNIIERLNNDNFNIYENDEEEGENSTPPFCHQNDPSAWQGLPNDTQVTEAFMRNNFYLLLTPKQRWSLPTMPKAPTPIAVNMTDLNTLINLRDGSQYCFDIRDDQEIHIRPVELYLPIDILFAGEHSIDGLYSTQSVLLPGDNNPLPCMTIQRIDHRRVVYVKLYAAHNPLAVSVMEEIQGVIQQICGGLALQNWYDYDLCFGRRSEQEENDTACRCSLKSGHHPCSRWYCGIRSSLAQRFKHAHTLRQWTWIDAAIPPGKIDFFYWHCLFLRKRLCLYDNPLNHVKFNAKQFIDTHSPEAIRGNILDLCFDCWNFTNNLGEIVSIFGHLQAMPDKKKNQKHDTQFLLSTLDAIINGTEQQLKKNDEMAVTHYIRHVVECLLLRVNREFVAMGAQQPGVRICLNKIFSEAGKKAATSPVASAPLHIAAECWLALRSAVRMIAAINRLKSASSRPGNPALNKPLIACTEQLIRTNKILFFSGLSGFNLAYLLSINQQNHLCITLDNGDRFMAIPLGTGGEYLDNNVNARLYMKSFQVKAKQPNPTLNRQARLFISPLDETLPAGHLATPGVEKKIQQPIFIKLLVKKKILPPLLSTSKVEYIAFDTDKQSPIARLSPDCLVKRIDIEEDNNAATGIQLIINDPDGRREGPSQIAILLNEIKVVTARKRSRNVVLPTVKFQFLAPQVSASPPLPDSVYAVPASQKTIFDDIKSAPPLPDNNYAVPASKKTIFDNIKSKPPSLPDSVYAVPTSQKTIFDDIKDEVIRKRQAIAVDMAKRRLTLQKNTVIDTLPVGIDAVIRIFNDRVKHTAIEENSIDDHKQFIVYFKNLYATLTDITKLIDMHTKDGMPGVGNEAINQRYRNNREKLKIAYAYLIKNHEKITCQQAILKNTVDLLDNVSGISMALISQKQYVTNEKMRQLLLGMVTPASHNGSLLA